MINTKIPDISTCEPAAGLGNPWRWVQTEVRVKTDVMGDRAPRRDALILARHFSAGTAEIRLRPVPLGTAEFYGRAFSLFIRPYGTRRMWLPK
jgi:hypothetical protein